MRKVFLPLLACLCAVPALAQWQAVSTPGNLGGELFNCQLDAIDAQTAWVANSFYFVPPHTVGIWRSTDGGQSWQNVAPAAPATGRFGVGSLEALDARNAWAMMQRLDAGNSPLPAELHYTADGGATWSRRGLPAGASGLGQLRFFSPTTGVLVDRQLNVVFRTTDGGQSWQPPVALPTLAAGQRLAELQLAPGLIWAQVLDPSAKTVGVWTSTDQGQTWRSQATPLGASSGVVFRDAQHGLLPLAAGGMVATADGGQTWTPATLPPFPLGDQGPLVAVQGSRAYVAGAFTFTGASTAKGSAVSTDEGQTWTPLETSNSYMALHFPTPDAGWHIRADFFGPTVQYVYQGMGRYTGPSLMVLATQGTQAALPGEVYPNPSADGRFTVRLPAEARVRQVRVLDALGREVYRAPALPAGQLIDLSQQRRGMYSLEIQTDTGLLRRKLLTN